jgi:hypothetical protein
LHPRIRVTGSSSGSLAALVLGVQYSPRARRMSLPLSASPASTPPGSPPRAASPSLSPLGVAAELSREAADGSACGRGAGSARQRRPPLFHLGSHDQDGSDGEEEPQSAPRITRHDSARTERTDGSGELASVGHSLEGAEDTQGRARGRAELRRYHALVELLMTELGYIHDLRVLVTVRPTRSVFDLSV